MSSACEEGAESRASTAQSERHHFTAFPPSFGATHAEQPFVAKDRALIPQRVSGRLTRPYGFSAPDRGAELFEEDRPHLLVMQLHEIIGAGGLQDEADCAGALISGI